MGKDSFKIEADISFDDGTVERINLDNAKLNDGDNSEATTPLGGVVAEIGEKKKNKKIHPILLASFIVLLLVGVGGYFLFLNKSSINGASEENKEETILANLKIDGNSLSDFDLSFLKYEINNKNMVYSPIAIKRTLKMLSDGTGGESKKQIDEVLGSYKVDNYNNTRNISFTNTLFIKEGLKSGLKKDYVDSINKYGAGLIIGDLSNANMANNVVKNASLGQIGSMFDFKDANNALASSLAFDMDWSQYALWCVNGVALPCKDYYGDYHGAIFSNMDNNEYIKKDGQYWGYSFGSVRSVNYIPIYYLVNRYDYIKDKGGEEEAKRVLTKDYRKWYWENKSEIDKYENETNDKSKYKEGAGGYVERLIDEIKDDYGKTASSTDFNIYEDNSVLAFSKDIKKYSGKQLSYVSIMPKDMRLKDFVENTNAKELLEITKKIKPLNIKDYRDGYIKAVSLHVPIFKYSYKLDLEGDLKKIGIKKVFEDKNKDFTGVGIDKLGDIKHEVLVNFSNDGIRDTVYKKTSQKDNKIKGPTYQISCEGREWMEKDSVSYPCEVEDVEDFYFMNKPFLFMIMDTTNGEAWYIGAVYQPTSVYN